MTFYIGCAIWAYKQWVGELYPPGSRSGDFLRLYGQRLTTVEGNTTFYSVPHAETVQRWAAETPETFQFCLKLPRDITHQGDLLPHLPQAIAFLHHMRPLGSRLGPLFAQLPPSYSPAQFEDLAAFLQGWPLDQAPLALEVRHRDWFRPSQGDRLNQCLQQLGVGRVLLDTRPIYECPDDPQLASERKKPRVPLQPVVTSNFALVRYISHPEPELNERWMAEWVPQIDTWLRQGTQVYLLIHCPVEARSPTHTRRFQALLERANVPVPPLPWDHLPAMPTRLENAQLSLF